VHHFIVQVFIFSFVEKSRSLLFKCKADVNFLRRRSSLFCRHFGLTWADVVPAMLLLHIVPSNTKEKPVFSRLLCILFHNHSLKKQTQSAQKPSCANVCQSHVKQARFRVAIRVFLC